MASQHNLNGLDASMESDNYPSPPPEAEESGATGNGGHDDGLDGKGNDNDDDYDDDDYDDDDYDDDDANDNDAAGASRGAGDSKDEDHDAGYATPPPPADLDGSASGDQAVDSGVDDDDDDGDGDVGGDIDGGSDGSRDGGGHVVPASGRSSDHAADDGPDHAGNDAVELLGAGDSHQGAGALESAPHQTDESKEIAVDDDTTPSDEKRSDPANLKPDDEGADGTPSSRDRRGRGKGRRSRLPETMTSFPRFNRKVGAGFDKKRATALESSWNDRFVVTPAAHNPKVHEKFREYFNKPSKEKLPSTHIYGAKAPPLRSYPGTPPPRVSSDWDERFQVSGSQRNGAVYGAQREYFDHPVPFDAGTRTISPRKVDGYTLSATGKMELLPPRSLSPPKRAPKSRLASTLPVKSTTKQTNQMSPSATMPKGASAGLLHSEAGEPKPCGDANASKVSLSPL